MVFSSLVFLLVFLPLVLAVYFLCRGVRARNIVLCVFSLVFYAWGEPVYLFLMLGMILVNYVCALIMGKSGKSPEKRGRKLPLAISLVVDIGAIGFFKYGDFALINLGTLLHINLPSMGLALPIGISFFTFQIMSYVLDVYKGEVPPQKSLLKLSTYICLFPQLVAGPIVRYQTVMRELDERHESLPLFGKGLHRFIIGLAKKVIFANQMALIADCVFKQMSAPTMIWWLGTLAYTLQIYFDFSGYSDMAIGMGHMFGFHFDENFNYPYIASSITDFWRRWHISLSTWFRDYVYIPLGGNRVKTLRHLLNMLCVWLLTGLWHGAAWNFVLWGLYYFVLLMAEKAISLKRLSRIPAFIRHIGTLFFVMMGWVLFRTENMTQLLTALHGLFTPQAGAAAFLLGNHDALAPIYLVLPACIASLPVWHKLHEKWQDRWTWVQVAADAVMYFVCIALLLGSTYNPFIYFRF